MVYPDAGFLYEFDANNNDIIRRSHSKLAVSSDITDNTFCMGDVNRRISGDRTRGGGVISTCIHRVLAFLLIFINMFCSSSAFSSISANEQRV